MSETQHEGALALRNGVKLASSLILTWGVALVITFKLPNVGTRARAPPRPHTNTATRLRDDARRLHRLRRRYVHFARGRGPAEARLGFLRRGRFGPHRWRSCHCSSSWSSPPVTSYRRAARGGALRDDADVRRPVPDLPTNAASRFTGRRPRDRERHRLEDPRGGGTLALVLLGAPFWTLPLPMLASEALC